MSENRKHRGFEWPRTRTATIMSCYQTAFQILYPLLGGIEVVGAENIPMSGRLIVCPNHISDADPSAAAAAIYRHDISSIAKSELFTIPILGKMLLGVGAFPIHRDTADRPALRHAKELLWAERLLLMFPEGHISQDGRLQKLAPGAALLAISTNTPIVPMGIDGTNRLLPYGRILPHPVQGGCKVVVGTPMDIAYYQSLPKRTAIDTMTSDLCDQLLELTGQAKIR